MKDFISRAAWLSMAVLFLVTGLGVGLVYFWQATHPTEENQSAQENTCVITTTATQTTLEAPEGFKPAGDVSKLETTDIKEGGGNPIEKGACLTVKYYGTLASDGKVFDENFTKPLALKFQHGTGQVIPGWDVGLEGMKPGGIRRLVIPSELAYGDQASASIPANSDLVFVVNLLTAQ